MLSDSLAKELMAMDIDEAIPLTRACGHYLNLVIKKFLIGQSCLLVYLISVFSSATLPNTPDWDC